MGGYLRAEPLMRRSLAIKEKVLGPDHPDVAIIAGNLGKIYTELKQYDKAEELLLKALVISKKTHGPVHPEYATIILKYQTMLHRSGKGAYVNEINTAIAFLEKAGDKRAERGTKLLAEINQ